MRKKIYRSNPKGKVLKKEGSVYKKDGPKKYSTSKTVPSQPKYKSNS